MTGKRASDVIAAIVPIVRTEAIALVVVAVVAGFAAVLVAVADAAANDSSHAFDFAVLRALHPGPDPRDPIGPAWFDRAAADFTSLGSVSVVVTVTLVVGGFLILHRRSLEAVLLALALGSALAISEGLKSFFGRERPPDIYRAAEALNPSFPSGHALLSAALYLSLGAMLARATSNRSTRVYIMTVAILITLLVGATRVYLGVHWASDVLAGWCIGAAWAMVFWLVERWARERLSGRRGMRQPPDGPRRTSTTS